MQGSIQKLFATQSATTVTVSSFNSNADPSSNNEEDDSPTVSTPPTPIQKDCEFELNSHQQRADSPLELEAEVIETIAPHPVLCN